MAKKNRTVLFAYGENQCLHDSFEATLDYSEGFIISMIREAAIFAFRIAAKGDFVNHPRPLMRLYLVKKDAAAWPLPLLAMQCRKIAEQSVGTTSRWMEYIPGYRCLAVSLLRGDVESWLDSLESKAVTDAFVKLPQQRLARRYTIASVTDLGLVSEREVCERISKAFAISPDDVSTAKIGLWGPVEDDASTAYVDFAI